MWVLRDVCALWVMQVYKAQPSPPKAYTPRSPDGRPKTNPSAF